MANSFSKEERVAFDQLLQDFQDALVMSRNVAVYKTDQTMMERTGDIIWRPQPYISVSYAGTDMTANFLAQTQLSVPATIGYSRSVPWPMNPRELRDALQAERLGKSAREKLASDINLAVLNVACNEGTLVYKSSAAASGFGDVASIEAIMNRVGIQYEDRYLALSTTDYNGLAKDLANRQNMVDMTKEAYRRGYVGMVASFETYKMDYSLRCTVAAGSGITMDTRVGAANYYVPKATSVATTGQRSNTDNRYQTITVSSTTNVAVGDALTVAGVNEAHHITKSDTGSLKTFRVIAVPSATTLVISPPIISNQGGTMAEQQYQNTVVATSASASLVFLNTAAAYINPFWFKDSIEILPGRYEVPMDAGAAVMRATTEQGIDLVLQKQYDINTMLTKYRLDTLYGVTMLQPEMAGIALFSQP
jgi:hypothetical protein